MSYNAIFNLRVTPPIHSLTNDDLELTELWRFIESEPEYHYGDLGYYDGSWVDWKPDMRDFSKKYPEHVFTLQVRGDGEGDLGIAYFKGGKMQMCPATITYEDYDEEKLS